MATKIRSGFCANMPWTAPHVQPFSSGNKVDKGLGQFGSTRYGPSTNSSLGFAGSTHGPDDFCCAVLIFAPIAKTINARTPIPEQTTAPTIFFRPTHFIGVPPPFSYVPPG